MKATNIEKQYYGNQVIVSTKEEDCIIYKLEDESGSAILTRYEVFPGIALVYNDVHKQDISIDSKDDIYHIFEINHCREGRIEFETAGGEYIYIKKGDIAVNTKDGVRNYSYFPLSHYHGVTIEIDFGVVEAEIPDVMKFIHIDLKKVKEKFVTNQHCYVFRENDHFEHLFAELYAIPEKIRKSYYQIKVMEILLFMSVLDVKSESVKNRYYNKKQVAIIKEIHNYMIKNIDKKLTINQLSEQYEMSATNVKKYFTEVYGNSIYAYLKEYRIQQAAKMLKSTTDDIAVIAGNVGYDNASKFASSFKSVMGITPNEFRKSV